MDSIKHVGGSFLLENGDVSEIFTPEDFTEEQRGIAMAAKAFADGEILPNAEAIRNKDFDITRKLLRACGKLDLLGIDIPEQYGGMDLSKVSSAIVTERLASNADFFVSYAAHTGIGTLPLVYFGTDAQKAMYLPRLASGEYIGAYALTESCAGSDPQAMKTTAILSPDGAAYMLNGTKLWITNAGFADLFTVFAKMGGDRKKITAFIVERGTPGFSIGPEEHKIGIKGSSTCALAFDNARIPAENVLGGIGDGFKIAMNTLNMGRFKLGVGCVCGAKILIRVAADYAKERKTFGRAIAGYGLIQQKLASMLREAWLCEGMIFRVAAMIDATLAEAGAENPSAAMQAIGTHAAECAAIKVYASEMLSFVAKEAAKIHGGNGFMDENSAARAYGDSLINEIFEGTNEINRLVIAGTILKHAQKGELGLFAAAKEYAENLAVPPEKTAAQNGALSAETIALKHLKQLTVMLYGALVSQCLAGGRQLEEEQEMLGALADATTDVLALETAIARTKKILARGKSADQEIALTESATAWIVESAAARAKRVIRRLYDGNERHIHFAGIKRLTAYEAHDGIALDRAIAGTYLADEWKFA